MSLMLLHESPRDWGVVILVGLLTVGANMPLEFAESLNLDRKYFLVGLIAVVGVALIKYLKFTLILVIALLAVGANLPSDVAKELGIDSQIALLGLVAMIIISLSNKVLKLPTGLEKSGRSKSAHGAAALFTAILKGRIAVVQSLIGQGVNVNVRTVSGKTPLMAAAFKGYSDIVQLLLESGANPNTKDSRGDSALKIATRSGFTRIVEILKKSSARLE